MHTAKKLGIVKIVGVAESERREGSSGNNALKGFGGDEFCFVVTNILES